MLLLLIKRLYYFFCNFSLGIKVFFLGAKYSFFDGSDYENKRIIILGPADTSLGYLSGAEIDSFDCIIRLNKSPLNLKGKEAMLGSRTDILYHCFNEDPISGGGIINFEILKEQENKYVIYPYFEAGLERYFYNVLLKYKEFFFYRLPSKFYNKLNRLYSAKIPTTGLQALNHVMSSEFKELHITGFTFFQTGYASGYRAGFEAADSGKELAKSAGNHCPDDEVRLFKVIFNQNKHKNIYLDDFLEKIVQE